MAQSERLHKIRKILDEGGCIRPDQHGFDLGVSRSTLKRDIAVLRDRLNAPITWSAERGGWIVDNKQSGLVVQSTGQGKAAECKALEARITQLDNMARQPQSGQIQDWIRDQKSKARDRQFGLRC